MTAKIAFIVLLTALCLPVSAGESSVRAGMTFQQVAQVMERHGISAEDRSLSEFIPAGVRVAYFPLEERVDLVVAYDREHEIVQSLSVTFYPAHRPVKGIDTSKEIISASVSEDGYTLQIRKAGAVK